MFSFGVNDLFTQLANEITWQGVPGVQSREATEASLPDLELAMFHCLVDSPVSLSFFGLCDVNELLYLDSHCLFLFLLPYS